MISSGREKLFSVFGNGRISDSCCGSENRVRTRAWWWWWGVYGGVSYQGLHVVHGPQVVPDDGGGHLPADVLAELVPDADHVEVAVHACRQRAAPSEPLQNQLEPVSFKSTLLVPFPTANLVLQDQQGFNKKVPGTDW